MQVTKQLGPSTFRLSDGSRWHASRLRRVAPPSCTTGLEETETSDLRVEERARLPPALGEYTAPLPTEPGGVRPARARPRPGYLKDFVTDF